MSAAGGPSVPPPTVGPWPTHRRTARPRARSRSTPGSIGSGTPPGGSSTSARPSRCAHACRPTSRTLPPCTPARRPWSARAPASSGPSSATRSRRCSWNTRGSRSSIRASTSDTATTSPTRSSRSPWGSSSPELRSCAAPSARAPATSGPTRMPGRSARRSTCSCACSRSARAAPACSSGRPRADAPVCWATSTSARHPASGGSPRTNTAPSPRSSATSWRATPPASSVAPSGPCTTPPPSWSSSGRLGCGTTSWHSPRRWRRTPWSWATRPTPTYSPSSTTSSKRPYRSSMSAAGESVANAGGWARRNTKTFPTSSSTSCSRSTATSPPTPFPVRCSSPSCPPTRARSRRGSPPGEGQRSTCASRAGVTSEP